MESEIERLTAEIERLNRHLKKLHRLISGAMFDMKNPMHVVVSSSNLLLESKELSLKDKNWLLEINNKNAHRVSSYLDVLQSLQHGAIYPADQLKKYFIKELIEIVQQSHERLPEKNGCKIDLLSHFNHTENDCVELPFLSFRYGVGLIIEEFIEIGLTDHIYVSFSKQNDLLQIEFAVETDNKTLENINQGLYYGYRFAVVELIFELYDGAFRTEKRNNRVVSILELPLVEMEEADAECN